MIGKYIRRIKMIGQDKTRQGKTRQDKTRQLYLTRVAQSAARMVSLGVLGSIGLTYTHLQ